MRGALAREVQEEHPTLSGSDGRQEQFSFQSHLSKASSKRLTFSPKKLKSLFEHFQGWEGSPW